MPDPSEHVVSERIEALSVLRMGVGTTIAGMTVVPGLLAMFAAWLLGLSWLDGYVFCVLSYWGGDTACGDVDAADSTHRRNAARVRNLYDWALAQVSASPPWYAFSRQHLQTGVQLVRYLALVWAVCRTAAWIAAQDWTWFIAPW